jgi:UDP-3-O-[3-hydroxymyristoyl] glucosamine N-acyltransferase
VTLKLGAIVAALGGELHGDPNRTVQRLAPLESAQEADLSFLSNPKYLSQLHTTRAGCVIVSPDLAQAAIARAACIVTADPYHYFARLTQLWKRVHTAIPVSGIHPSAQVHASAVIDATAQIGALCVVEAGARVGAGSVLKARVTLGENCTVGERCTIHSGAVVGADGFGFASHQVNGQRVWEKIEQLGAVRIGNDVEIGANTCIDRGALNDTVIEDGVKLDNLIQVAHNVRIGKHTAIAGCTAIAGSTKIGAYCTIAGAVNIVGHLSIADHVHISATTLVSHSIAKPGHYTGAFPMDEHSQWEKNAATLRQLHALRERIRQLEKSQKS